jgi:hypothetical protein
VITQQKPDQQVLEFVKKTISSFMPNRNVQWNVESQTGNPTMSLAVNDLIKKIKKAEVRKLGKKYLAKNPMQNETRRGQSFANVCAY